MIAYFGTGLLGSGFVRRMLENGETVHIWNRTHTRAKALEAHGAKVFTDPAEAVRGADQLHLTLSDDASVDAVLEPLAGTLTARTIVLDHTTTAPTPTAERTRRWKERGVTYVHTPVFMGPQNAREGNGIMLLSGDPAVRERVKPLVAKLTGTVLELGDDPARAAAFKLFGNMMLVFIVSGLADLYRFAASLGIEPAEAHTLFRTFNPARSIEGRGKAMAHGNFGAAWELAMARKDVRLMLEEAARHDAELHVLPSIATLFDRYVQAGHGREDVGVVAKLAP
jgi:3-hydroxyisobutyrate dehydrogenase